MQIRIEGLEAAIEAFNSYAESTTERLSQGIAEGCMIVEGEAIAEAPEDTGALRESIHSQMNGLTGTVGTNIEYAIYQEFGTYKMRAHPFLVPALKSKKEEVINTIKENLK